MMRKEPLKIDSGERRKAREWPNAVQVSFRGFIEKGMLCTWINEIYLLDENRGL
jgi:hypothetical protein